MENTIMLIDDDANIRKMLEIIIKKNNLGKIICQLNSGEYVIDEIAFYNPDIILIDLLLPFKDGIAIVNEANEKNLKNKFIMISQVDSQELISSAYESGILFYIKKPINSVEVINVIKNVSKILELETSLSAVKSAVLGISESNTNLNFKTKSTDMQELINTIFTDIGIIGMNGSNELRMVLFKIIDFRKRFPHENYKLNIIYDEILNENNQDEENNIAAKRAMEQRIRRVLQKALTTIAELGCEDYYNSIFTEYSTLLFDFKQVRQEMRHIAENSDAGKINTKKFIEGILTKLIVV